MPTSYIISSLDQLIYVPKNSFGIKIVLETVRNIRNYNNVIFKLIQLKLYDVVISSLLYDISFTNGQSIDNTYPYVYNIEEIIDILNKNGFDIEYQQKIQLNSTEQSILENVYGLGYYYIQCGRYGQKEEPLVIYITKNPTNAYSANQEFMRLDEITTNFDVNDFVWLREKPYNSLSIPLLLNREYPEPIT